MLEDKPLRAPKHENATMNANRLPPIGPKRALPKSIATVLLRPTVVWNASEQKKIQELDSIGRTLSSTTK